MTAARRNGLAVQSGMALEDAELEALTTENLEHHRLRGTRLDPAGRLHHFAQKYGRTLAAVYMRAYRRGLRSYKGGNDG